MHKIVATVGSVMVSLGLATLLPAQPPPADYVGPMGKVARGKGAARKKGEREIGGDLRKAYDLLRRLRADDLAAARPDDRLRNWTDRAVELYREGLRLQAAGESFRAREYGTAAHDLARAVDHARNATRYDRPDPALPAPSGNFGAGDTRDRAYQDLYRAYQRLAWPSTWPAAPGSEVYVEAARDLYNAARRDFEAGRDERSGELARASEAMTHVPEHLAQAGAWGAYLRPAAPPASPGPVGERVEPPTGAATGVGGPPLPPIVAPR